MAETKGFFRKVCIAPGRLDGKVAVVTGANAGIGFVTVSELARRGATVIMACRNMEKGNQARRKILETYGANNPKCLKIDVGDPSVVSFLKPVESHQLELEELDLASLQSVRDFANRIKQKYHKLDFLVNNAGLITRAYSLTVDGFEMQIEVNHLAPVLLTHLLLPLLKTGSPSRIVFVGSFVHRYATLYKPDLQMPKGHYHPVKCYYQCKLANVMFARELNKRLEGTGVTSVSLHPGIVDTNLFGGKRPFFLKTIRTLLAPFEISPWMGAQTTLFTLLTANLVPGAYYDNCTVRRTSRLASNDAECQWLWEASYRLLNLTNLPSGQL